MTDPDSDQSVDQRIRSLDEIRAGRAQERMNKYDGKPDVQSEITLHIVADLVDEAAACIRAWRDKQAGEQQ